VIVGLIGTTFEKSIGPPNDLLDVENLLTSESLVAPASLKLVIDDLLRQEKCKKVPIQRNVTSSDGMCHASYSSHFCVGQCASIHVSGVSASQSLGGASLAQQDFSICQSCAPITKTMRLALKCQNDKMNDHIMKVQVVRDCVCMACSTV